MTVSDKLARYEAAIEVLGFKVAQEAESLMASRRSGASSSVIETHLQKQAELTALQLGLSLHDQAAVTKVLDMYGADVKSNFGQA